MTSAIRFLVLLVLAAIAVAQTTWTVDRFNRPGAQFTDLPAAVAAAASGDVILLRATTADPADSYLAPAVQGKGLTILGEMGPGLPRVVVTGSWYVNAIPANAAVIVSNVHITYGNGRILQLTVTNCAGAVVFRAVGPMVFSFFTQPTLADNELLVFSNCVLDMTTGPIQFVRCKVMMDNVQVLRNNPGFGSNGSSVILLDSDLHLAGCDIRGAQGNALNSASSRAVEFSASSTRGNLFINKTSRLEAGVNTFGSREQAIWYSANTPDCSRVQVVRDPGATIVEGYPSYCMPVNFLPVSGLRTSTNQNVLLIEQDTVPLSPTILLMAPFQPAPWNNIIGPCFLDQNFVWSSFDVAPSSGPLRRTFTIPPTIPPGQWIGVQGFEYEAFRNRIHGTNVTVVGVL